jgi:multisubunit Na+/H+ antiporter MnhG subunit
MNCIQLITIGLLLAVVFLCVIVPVAVRATARAIFEEKIRYFRGLLSGELAKGFDHTKHD